MTVSRPYFDLIVRDMEAAKARMLADLNRDLFVSVGPPKPPPRFWRLKRVYWRVYQYVATLWAALKGEDPYSGDDY